ncbi:hypothetical protein ACP3VS_22845 [Lysinibacillus sp. VIII_CA]|uniref:hypothetical protein n=1 Tax=Lysinibacillus sp. VIII_CA TaxID=3417452 RepID=UPI003CED664C
MHIEIRLLIPTIAFIRDLKIHNVTMNNQPCICSDPVRWHCIIGRDKDKQEVVIDLEIEGWIDINGNYVETMLDLVFNRSLSIEYELMPSFVAQKVQLQMTSEKEID